MAGSDTRSLNSFGPNMHALELLKAGRRDAVLEYFGLCENFWEPGKVQLHRWSNDVKKTGVCRPVNLVSLGVAPTTLVAAALVFCLARDATAFDVSGIRSGMPREQALAVLGKAGFRVFPNQTDPNLLGASREGTTHTLKFCQNRLENYSHTLSGGVTAFIRRSDVLTRERGTGQPEIVSGDRGSPLDSFGLSWRVGNDYVKLSYVAASRAHEESVSLTYLDSSVCK